MKIHRWNFNAKICKCGQKKRIWLANYGFICLTYLDEMLHEKGYRLAKLRKQKDYNIEYERTEMLGEKNEM